MKIWFYANAAKSDAAEVRGMLSRALAAHSLEEAATAGEADMIVALGGDGTIIGAVHAFPGKPVAGFNIGSLGYLASVERRDFEHAVGMIAAGAWRISRRTLLECSVAGREIVALNDIVLARERSGQAVAIDVAVGGRRAARYFADGVIFATPTGSTAYSLSAGGPVLMPDSASFAITPLNPHALASRPIVVGDGIEMSATPRSRGEGRDQPIAVYADGAGAATLGMDETLSIRKSPRFASLVEFDGHDPYRVMSLKLGWPGGRQDDD